MLSSNERKIIEKIKEKRNEVVIKSLDETMQESMISAVISVKVHTMATEIAKMHNIPFERAMTLIKQHFR
jgi:hypothetical protein